MKSWSACCCLVLLLLNAHLMAQDNIEPEDIPLEGGTILSFFTAQDMINGIEVDPGAAGGDRMWDFTGFEFDEIVYDTLFDPEEAPGIEEFPNANRVIKSEYNDLGGGIGRGFQYEAVTDSGWFMLGSAFSYLDFEFPIIYPEPPTILPMPTEYEDEWDIAVDYTYGMVAPDTLMEGALDSIYITIEIGGFAEIDAWGTVRFSGGELPALRQHITTGSVFYIVGVMTIFDQRFEIPVYENEIDASHAYRWFAPGFGEIASFMSMISEENPDFELASEVRIRCVLPDLVFQEEPVSFGEVRVGNAGIADFTIANSGEGMGIIDEVDFPEELAEELEVITELPLDIETDGEANLRFLWTPQQECTINGVTVEIFHNDQELDNPLIVELTGVTTGYGSAHEQSITPIQFTLGQNFPDPFNSQTYIPFALPSAGAVTLEVFDLAGKSVYQRNIKVFESGMHVVSFSAGEIPAGVYIYRLNTGTDNRIKTMHYIK